MLNKYLPICLLFVCSVGLLILCDRPLIRGDGVAYLAWVDSFVLDGDVDLENQAQRLAPVNTYQVVPVQTTGRYANAFPFGVAILHAPFYLLGDWFLLNGIWNENPEYFHAMQGVERPYSMWLMIGANLFALGAIWLAFRLGQQVTDRWSSALVAFTVFIGTPLIYYSTTDPLNSHNPGALVAAIFVTLLLSLAPLQPDEDHGRRWWRYVLLGLSGALMVLVRWQLLLIAAPAWAVLLAYRQWRGAALAGFVFLLGLVPLFLVWDYLFGQAIVVPYAEIHGESFSRPPLHVHQVFWRTIEHSPIIMLSLLGLVPLWRLNRVWAGYCGGVIVLQLVTNGSVKDWWAGDAYGMRRMTELYPIYVLLACALLGQPVRWRRLVLSRAVVAVIIPFSVIYLMSFYVYHWSPNTPFSGSTYDMLAFFEEHTWRAEFLRSVSQTHLGPRAWDRPGP